VNTLKEEVEVVTTGYYVAPALPFGSEAQYRRDRFRAHLAAVGTVAAAGLDVPNGWTELKGRYESLIETTEPIADRLARELIGPTGQDVSVLWVLAIADEQATGEADAAVLETVRRAVLDRLLALYSTVSLKNYRAAAARYNDTVKLFTEAADAIDPEGGTDQLRAASSQQRDSYFDLPGLTAELESHLATLCAAAALAGLPPDTAFIGSANDTETTAWQLALAVDATGCHRRKVWAAWSTTSGRCGRWSALHTQGVKLRAASHLDRLQPYEKPKPYITVVDRDRKLQRHDPHDGALPAGWQIVEDGWQGEASEWSAD
jgi:hypothetical protein